MQHKLRTALTIITENNSPRLTQDISDEITTALRHILTSKNADKIWDDSTSSESPQSRLLYTEVVSISQDAQLTLVPMNVPEPTKNTSEPAVLPPAQQPESQHG